MTEANNQQHNSNTIVEDPAWLICSSISRCADDWERVSLESDDRPILSWLSSVDTYIRYLAGYRPIIRGTPGASHFRLISLANTETLLSPSFMLVKYCSIWKLHLFTIRQSLIQSLHLSIKTLPSLSSMLLQIWLKSLFCESI